MNDLNLKNQILRLGLSVLIFSSTLTYAGNEMNYASVGLSIQAAAELPKLPISPEIVTEINTRAPQEGPSLEDWSIGDSDNLHLSDDLIEANRDFLEFQESGKPANSF